MLTVTTFSLTVMVSVHRAAAAQFTPRALRELLKDTTTQTVLATFVGAWIFALSGIVLTSTTFFGDKEIAALYLATIVVLGLIVIVTLRWIIHLQALGSLIDTAARMETEAERAIRLRLTLATETLHEAEIPHDAQRVAARETGFVRVVYEQALQQAAEAAGAQVYLVTPPGSFVQAGDTLAMISTGDAQLEQAVIENVQVGLLRSTEQDPRFAVIQLAELGSKALSPGINDLGTAIDVIGRLARVLRAWEDRENHLPPCPRVWAPVVDPQSLLWDAFGGISRDGAQLAEVQVALQKRLAGLGGRCDPELTAAVAETARLAYLRAREALTFPEDRRRLDAATPDTVRNAAVRG